MKQLLKFLRLPVAEKKLFFHALYLLTVYRVRLRTIPIQKLFYRVQSLSQTNLPASPGPVSPARMARLIRIASHFIPGSTCLSNALAAQILFSSYGHKTKLHIGVARDQKNTFEAHAWLSLEGAIIIGSLRDLDRYQELPSLPTNNSL